MKFIRNIYLLKYIDHFRSTQFNKYSLINKYTNPNSNTNFNNLRSTLKSILIEKYLLKKNVRKKFFKFADNLIVLFVRLTIMKTTNIC